MLERDAELRLLRADVAATRAGHGRTVFIEGAPGVGKTALMEATAAEARRTDLRVLMSRGGELEQEFPFGIARHLLEPVVHPHNGDRVPGLFAGPARLAAGLLDVMDDGDAAATLPPGPDGAQAAVHALWWLIIHTSRHAPMAVLVDDAHWADAPSLQLLAYLARRIAEVPVLLVVALRPVQEQRVEQLTSALTRTTGATRLRLPPLSPVGASTLVRRLIPTADDELCDAYYAATGGNPFLLSELAGNHERSNVVGGGSGVPPRLADSVLARVRQGPPGSLALARAVAVLGRDVSLRHAATVAGLSLDDAASAADALAASTVLLARRPLEFCHPVIATTIADNIPPGERSAAHLRAARLLAEEEGAPARIGAHLLATEPDGDAWSCEHLLRASRDALSRGAPEVAVRFLQRALDEPPLPEARGAVLLELGAAEALALRVEPAIRHLRSGLDRIREPEVRLQGALQLAEVLAHSGQVDESVRILSGALKGRVSGSSAVVSRAEASLVNISRNQRSARLLVADHTASIVSRVLSGQESAPPLLAAVAAELGMAGSDAPRMAQLAEQALSGLGEEWDRFELWPQIAVRCLAVAGRPVQAQQALDTAVARARHRGNLYQLRLLLMFRAEAALRAGDLRVAKADARESFGLVSESGWAPGMPFVIAVLVLAYIEHGEHAIATRLIADAGLEVPPGDLPDQYPNHYLLLSRGRLRMESGDVRAGVEDLLECGRREKVIGDVNPAVFDWRSQAALGLSTLGDTATAQQLLREELDLARTFGSAAAIGVAERALGLVDQSAAGIEWLQRAVTTLESSEARVEHARALVELGSALLRAGHRDEAEGALRSGLDLAHRCGASALIDVATTELRATGARPRRAALTGRGSLTPTEERVAGLASTGSSNREIATALVVSVRTVEFHLSAVYRKLGAVSRRELLDALGRDAAGIPV